MDAGARELAVILTDPAAAESLQDISRWVRGAMAVLSRGAAAAGAVARQQQQQQQTQQLEEDEEVSERAVSRAAPRAAAALATASPTLAVQILRPRPPRPPTRAR